MKLPRISIITPSYNQGAFIEETILSVINQNYPNLEYIIIDGKSQDNSLNIIQKYKDRLSYWASETDRGQSDALNKGFNVCTGDIVTWLNSDDILMPGSLHTIAQLFSEYPENVGLIHGGTILFSNSIPIRTEFGYPDNNHERYLAGMAFPQPSSFFRKKYFDLIGPLNVCYHYGMDYDLFSRLTLVSDFIKVDHIFSKYRVHPLGKSIKDGVSIINEWNTIFCNLCEQLSFHWISRELKKLGLFSISGEVPGFHSGRLNRTIDQKKLLFYFLSHVVRYDYWNGNFDRSRSTMRYLNKHYSSQEILAEKGLSTIKKRLFIFNNGMIRFLRATKQWLGNK